jgi:hypothetical protein
MVKEMVTKGFPQDKPLKLLKMTDFDRNLKPGILGG